MEQNTSPSVTSRSSCRACGRTLTNPKHAALGLGPVCAKKKPWLKMELLGQQRLPGQEG
jgi:hypothetical protein